MAPQTKASFAHEFQAALRQLPARDQARVTGLCGPAWTDIETAAAASWVNEATFNAMNEAARSALGDASFVSLYREVGGRLAKNPSFQKAAEALIRLLGVNPHTLLKLSPRVRASVVQDSGTMTYTRVSATEAGMEIKGFPTSTWGLGTTALLLKGCLEGAVAVMGATPLVEVKDLSLTGGGCRYRVTWTFD